MKKILILFKLLLLGLIVSGQPTIDSSTWNKKVLNSNVYVRAGMIIDSSVIVKQDLQADSCDFDYIYSASDVLSLGNITGDNILTNTTSTNDLGSYAVRFDSAYIDDVVITNNFMLDNGASSEYLFTQNVNNNKVLALANTESGANCGLHFFASDGDGTDNASFALYGVGTTTGANNTESVILQYKASSTDFNLRTAATGTGAVRQLSLYTGANTDQLTLNTDGSVTFSGTHGVYGTMGFADSAVTLDMTQNLYAIITQPYGNLWIDGIEVGDLVYTGDSVQVVTAGNYKVQWDLCYSGSNTDEMHIEIFVAGVGQSGKGESIRSMTTSNKGCSSGNTILTIGANEWISLRISNMNSGNNATIVSGNLTITKQ